MPLSCHARSDSHSDAADEGTFDDSLKPLAPLYQQAGQIDRLNGDLEYLTKAYQRMGSWWNENFVAMDRCQLVILAEAPKFGSKES